MQMKNKTKKSNALLDEHKKEYGFYSNRRKAGFIRRCRNFAKVLDVNSTDKKMCLSVMAMDIISMRTGIDIMDDNVCNIEF